MIKKIAFTATILLFTVAIAMVIVSTGEARRHNLPRRGHRVLRGMAIDIATELTDEQRAEIHDRVIEMREDGATRDEIRETVAEMLEDFGVEVPDEWFVSRAKDNYLFADLTDEQRTTIHKRVVQMRKDGATRDEIRETFAEMLKDFGVELPEECLIQKRLQKQDRNGTGNRDRQRLREQLCADMAIIDSEIQAAPQMSPNRFRRISKVWAGFKK